MKDMLKRKTTLIVLPGHSPYLRHEWVDDQGVSLFVRYDLAISGMEMNPAAPPGDPLAGAPFSRLRAAGGPAAHDPSAPVPRRRAASAPDAEGLDAKPA